MMYNTNIYGYVSIEKWWWSNIPDTHTERERDLTDNEIQ